MKRLYKHIVAHPLKNKSRTSRGSLKSIETGITKGSAFWPMRQGLIWLGAHTMFSAKKDERAKTGWQRDGFDRGYYYPWYAYLTIEDAERLAAGLMLAIAEAREVTP